MSTTDLVPELPDPTASLNKAITFVFGSHLFGTSTPDSDQDFKVIYLPTAAEILLGTAVETVKSGREKKENERNTKDDIDIEALTLKQFMKLLVQGQTVSLDLLFAPDNFITFHSEFGKEIWKEIQANKEKLVHRGVEAFIGYAREQAIKYGIKGSRMEVLTQVVEAFEKLPPRDPLVKHQLVVDELIARNRDLLSADEEPLILIVQILAANKRDYTPHLKVCGKKFPMTIASVDALKPLKKRLDNYGARAKQAHQAGGKDWKALSHAVRVADEGIELLRDGRVTLPRPNSELLLEIKNGEMLFDDVSNLIIQGLDDLEAAQLKSELRDQADVKWTDQFVKRTYREVVLREAISQDDS